MGKKRKGYTKPKKRNKRNNPRNNRKRKANKKKRPSLRPIKEALYITHDTYCWLCMRKLPKQRLTGHHVVPFRICQRNEEGNIFILCEHCHFEVVNKIPYNTLEYKALMIKIRRNGEELKRRKS